MAMVTDASNDAAQWRGHPPRSRGQQRRYQAAQFSGVLLLGKTLLHYLFADIHLLRPRSFQTLG